MQSVGRVPCPTRYVGTALVGQSEIPTCSERSEPIYRGGCLVRSVKFGHI
jgi:hypothetical protein